MKKFIFPLCMLCVLMISCNDEDSKVSSRNEETDGPVYCVCNPCNPNVSWNTATQELSPKMDCREECPSGGAVTSVYDPHSVSAEFLLPT